MQTIGSTTSRIRARSQIDEYCTSVEVAEDDDNGVTPPVEPPENGLPTTLLAGLGGLALIALVVLV